MSVSAEAASLDLEPAATSSFANSKAATQMKATRSASATRAISKQDGEQHRPVSRRQTRQRHSDAFNQPISVHYDAVTLDVLLQHLRPAGWTIQFDAGVKEINPKLVFHAETTRRRALDELLLSLGLEGIFYEQQRLILISNGG